jgi:putative tryptophan/tyrosine transport system substrate-binding protein
MDDVAMAHKHIWKICGAVLVLTAFASTHVMRSNKVRRIGYLAAVSVAADTPRLEAFRQGMRGLGYVEGQNIIIDYRHESADFSRLSDHAAELVRLKAELIVTVTTNAALAAKKTIGALPMVFMGVTDPVAAGLVHSLAQPGANRTGVTNMAAILTGKRLELLKEILPGARRIAVLWDPEAPGSKPQLDESLKPAQALGLTLHPMPVSRVENFEAAFKEAANMGCDAIWMTLNPLANSNQKILAGLSIKYRLPSICAREDYAQNGCMLAYGPSYAGEGKDAARYVDKILKGEKPSEIPVEQPMRFILLLNEATVEQIGLTVPQSVLFRVDGFVR